MREIIISVALIVLIGCVTTALPKDPMITCILAKCKIEPAKSALEKPED